MDELTAVILTKNEEETIGGCIGSVNFCKEVMVIDDNSSDRTRVRAKELGVRVYKRELAGDYASQRNFGLGRARTKWVLFVDADETVSGELAEEIGDRLKGTKCDGFYLKRDDFWEGKRIRGGEWRGKKLLRLGKRGKGKWERRVHEVWKIRGKIGIMRGKLRHNQNKRVREMIEKIGVYSKIHESENRREGKGVSLGKVMFYPWGKLVDNLIIKRGMKDGELGLVLAMIISFHSFLGWSGQWLRERE